MRLVKLPWGDYVNPADAVAVVVVKKGTGAEAEYFAVVRLRCGTSARGHAWGFIVEDPEALAADDAREAAEAINGTADPYRSEP